MKRMFASTGTFFKDLKSCLSAAWQDSDCHYHIPKSRFKDNGGEEGIVESSPLRLKAPAKNYFLGSFRDCFWAAWKASDEEYYIPKNRWADPEHNKIAYRSSTGPGPFRRVSRLLSTVSHCISTAWKDSDHFYYLPKSSYQDPVFVKEKMSSAPKPGGLLFLKPLSKGVVGVSDGTGKGWSVEPPKEKPERTSEFIIPPGAPGPGDRPELEI